MNLLSKVLKLTKVFLPTIKTCTLCKNVPDNNSVIKCMNCKEKFHSCCLLKPVTPKIMSSLNNNPSLWWFCLSCLKTMDNECSNESTPDNHIEDLKTMMEEMKKSIIHEVNVTIDNKLQSQKEDP